MDFSNKTTMEIGPLHRPFILKSEGDVLYVDHADTETIRRKYKDDPLVDVADIVEIDAVWGEQTLADCLGSARKVDYIIASHVIEHVPDLITWLMELKSVLKTDGEIRLVVPDKRFTFDYTRRVTELSDVVDAYLRKARRPLSLYILDHVVNVRHVDVGAAWAGPLDIEVLVPYHSFEMAVGVAKDALETTNYHDVHCWVFTPYSFARLIRQLAENGLLDLECQVFEDTLRNTLEFTVFLRATDDKKAIVESWRRMEMSVNQAVPELSQCYLLCSKEGREAEREAALATALVAARAEAAAYSASTSWKITAPLRKIIQLIRTSGWLGR